MARLRIDLAYDGTGFRGFARQPGKRTVQGVLEDALSRLLPGDAPVATTVAGRTDRGVHAAGQTVHVDVPGADVDVARLHRAIAGLCGPEIAIWSVVVVADDFDARFSARRRRYRYEICDAPAIDPLRRHAVWHVGPPRLDVGLMRDGARHLLGEHDFSSFCRRSGDQHLIRRIDLLDVTRDRTTVTVRVEGPAFCHQMVRSVVGCLLPVGRGTRPPVAVADVLAARDRAAIGRVAPPHGLLLVGVDYPPSDDAVPG